MGETKTLWPKAAAALAEAMAAFAAPANRSGPVVAPTQSQNWRLEKVLWLQRMKTASSGSGLKPSIG